MATVIFSKPSFVMSAANEAILNSYISQAFPGVDFADVRHLVATVVQRPAGSSPDVRTQLYLQHVITPEEMLQRAEDGESLNVVSVTGNDILITEKYDGGIILGLDGDGMPIVMDTVALRGMIVAVFGVSELDAHNVAGMSFVRETPGGSMTAQINYRKDVTAAQWAAGIEAGECSTVLDTHQAYPL